jgi:hypothetical protein
VTPGQGLIFICSSAAVPAFLAISSWLSRRAWRRSLTAVLLVAMGINVQFGSHPWRAGLVTGLALMAAALPSARSRWLTLLLIALGGSFLIDPGIAAASGRQFFSPEKTQILLVVSGFLVAVVLGSVMVEQTIKLVRGLPASSEEAELPLGAPAGGQAIGMLERTLVYAAVLVGHPEAAALVVAVKSVARYPEFARDRKFAEYFLVGTLLSLLVALGVGYLIRAALISVG